MKTNTFILLQLQNSLEFLSRFAPSERLKSLDSRKGGAEGGSRGEFRAARASRILFKKSSREVYNYSTVQKIENYWYHSNMNPETRDQSQADLEVFRQEISRLLKDIQPEELTVEDMLLWNKIKTATVFPPTCRPRAIASSR